ncbi:MAG TPA: hypothetical protein VFL14_16465 [Xanthomonadales bacterium]|nr:hypothetical protein [Xanthomonadales bacterium]
MSGNQNIRKLHDASTPHTLAMQAWSPDAREEVEHEREELLRGFEQARRLFARGDIAALGVQLGRQQLRLRSFVRRVTQLVGDAMIAGQLERDSARRCFDACDRLEHLWLELRDLREETHAVAWSPRQQLALGGRLARLADLCGHETRAACLGNAPAPAPR